MMEFIKSLPWSTIISVLLGTGVATAGVNIFFEIRREKSKRQNEFLLAQVTNLYGPVSFHILRIKKLLEIHSRINDGYTINYINDTNGNAALGVTGNADKTIDIQNSYISQITPINQEIAKIFAENFAYIDEDDLPKINIFYENFIRLKTERVGDKLSIPLEIYRHVGDISFAPKEFLDGIEVKFKQKQGKLGAK